MPAIHKECHSSRYAGFRWPICIWIGNFYDPVLIVSGWRPAVWHSPLHYQLCHHSPYYCACPPPREEWSAASNECWIPGLFSVTFVSNDRAGPDWPNSDQLEWARGMAGRPDGPLVGRNTGTTPPLLCQISGCFWSISVGGPVAAITGPVAQLFTFSLFWLTSACALVALTFSLSNLSTYVLHW